MEADEHKLEALLRGMSPGALDERLLERLELAVSGGLQRPDVTLSGMQAKLRDLKPAMPREEFRDRLAGVVEGVPFPVDEKVVLFPGVGRTGRPAPRPRRPWVSAAAAVGLLGALSAYLLSPSGETPQVAAKRQAPSPAPKIERGAFVPATFGSDLSDTRDLGVHWSDNRRPMRVTRVVYRDKVSFTNDAGEKVEVEVPRVEFVVIPEKID